MLRNLEPDLVIRPATVRIRPKRPVWKGEVKFPAPLNVLAFHDDDWRGRHSTVGCEALDVGNKLAIGA